MKKKAFVILVLWMVSSALVFNGCKSKLPVLEKEKAIDLVKKINAVSTGFQIEADISAVEINADPKSSKKAPRYFITLLGPKLTFNSSVYKEINYPFPEFVLNFDCEKMVFHYGPKDKYLGLASVSGLSFELNTDEILIPSIEKMRKSGKEIPLTVFKFSYGEFSLDKLNISPMLEEHATLIELITEVAALNTSMKTRLEKLNVEILSEYKEKGLSQVKISVDSIQSSQDTVPDFITLMFSQAEESKGKLIELLEEPRTLFDVFIDAEGLSFSFKKEGKKKTEVYLDKIKLGEYLKSSKEKGFYNFGIALDFQGSNFISPENKTLETLGKIKQLKKEFNVDHISPSLLQTYFELIKMTQSLQMEGSKEASPDMNAFGLRMMNEVIQSKLIISFSLSPLEHHFGKLEAEGKFEVHGVTTPPPGQATATFYDLAGLEDRILKENIFPEEAVRMIMDSIRKYFVQDKKGNGKLIFEVREEEPYIFLNDEPIKIGK
jgi:hypothetical protein